MNPDSPVTLRRLSYRGVVNFHLGWEEEGAAREATFESEAEAVVQMAAIEERLRLATMSGKGYTVNPFGGAIPFITSKDVHFAALRLQPRGLNFRDAITHHVAAVTALNGTGASVTDAAREYAEAFKALKPFDVSLSQALFEWVELKKQVGDRPLFEVLRRFLQETPVASGKVPSAEIMSAPAVVPGPEPVKSVIKPDAGLGTPAASPVTPPVMVAPPPTAVGPGASDLTMAPFPAIWPPSSGKRTAG